MEAKDKKQVDTQVNHSCLHIEIGLDICRCITTHSVFSQML